LRDVPTGDAMSAPSLAYLPGVDGVDLRITMRGSAASEELARVAQEIRRAVPDCIYGEDDTDLAAVLLEGCRADRMRIAVAESCTGGLLGARLTAIPGSSDVFLGGVIAYSNEVKVAALGIPLVELSTHGAVSEPVVRAMAVGAAIIGVNSRNLNTLEVDMATFDRLLPLMPRNVVRVAESGLKDGDDLRRLREAGYHAFLVGERFMSAEAPGHALADLITQARSGAPS